VYLCYHSISCYNTSQEVSFTSFTLINASSKALALSFLEKSEEEDMSSNPKMPTASGITIDRLFSKKISFIKLPVAFSASIPEEKAYTMS